MIDTDDPVELALDIPREDLPPNSAASKKQAPEGPSEPVKGPSKPPQPASGPKYQVRKKSLWKRIKEAFIGDDMKSIPEYLLFDVAIPSVKSLFRESGYAIVDRTFGPGARRAASNREDSGYLVPYDRPTTRRDGSPVRPGINFDDFWFQYENDAREQLNQIRDLFNNSYDGVTVAQVKELFRMTPKSIDNKWGWVTARNADIVRRDGGWIIYMPPAKYLD